MPTPEESYARAEALLRARFDSWRGRVERAAGAAAEAARGPDDPALFREAARIVAETRVDGLAVIDWSNRARFWAGRTFELDPEYDCFGVRQGLDIAKILDHPAHPVLMAARPAGEGIAVAFLAFDERFPERRNLSAAVARRSGLAAVRLRFGNRNVPVRSDRRTFVIERLVHATLHPRSPADLAEARAAGRRTRLRTVAFLVVALLSWSAWRASGRRLPRDSGVRVLLGLALLAGLRALLAALHLPPWPLFHIDAPVHPLWAGAGDTLLTGLTACLGAILVARAAAVARARTVDRVLAGTGVAACLVLARLYAHLVTLLVRRFDDVVLFDPLRVLPGLEAALLLGSLCLLTGALFLCVFAAGRWAARVHRAAAPLPYVALAAGLLPWHGPWLALTCGLAAVSLRRGTTRPEKAAALTVLAALASFPVLYDAARRDFVAAVAARAGELVRRSGTETVQQKLQRAVAAATDPSEGFHREVAHVLAEEDRERKHLAFRLWAAADWDPAEPCAVQVWTLDGRLASAFDFDSPPSGWLPAPPAPGAAGARVLAGRGEGGQINFYVHDVPLKTIGDERLVGTARFLVPDRWDMLLSPLRPSIFREPLDLLVRAAPPPLLLASLDAGGTPTATSSGTTADLKPPAAALLERARKDTFASRSIRFRGQPALLVLVAGRYEFAGLVFEDSLLRQGGFVFARVMLAYAATWLVYVLGLLVARRRIDLLFRHRVALVLVALSIPPAVILAYQNDRSAVQRHERGITERLDNRLDLAQALLRGRKELPDHEWCAAVATNHKVDINVYRKQNLLATSRPGVWDTGLLGRRLAAAAYVALALEGRRDYGGLETFGSALNVRVAYRRIQHRGEELILAAPALEDRRAIEREATQSNAALLAVYLLAAVLTVFGALVLARSLTRPVQDLREATSRVAAGELDAVLPETRRDEFGDLIKAFNRMTVELQEAQDLRVRAEKAAAWREMARQVGHEIKNPLTPIKLTVQNLLAVHKEDPDLFDEEFERGAALILDQIAALHRIAGAFSAYARFPSQRVEPVDVNELIAETAELYGAAGGAIDVQQAPEPLVVRADHDELRRVLINLVTNARQAGATRVVLRAAADAGRARLDVIDDGGGIPDGTRERIFEPSFTTKTSGTGLGLPIVKRIVDDYGGTIRLASTPGGGTCVTVHLPLRV